MQKNEKPDALIEEFWYGLKTSMQNFYKNTKNNAGKKQVEDWSRELNKLQEDQNYDEIEYKVREYIALFALHPLKECNSYHMGILFTNIKRWNRISNKFQFKPAKLKDNSILSITRIYMLIDIYKSITTMNLNVLQLLFQDPNNLFEPTYSLLIDFSVKYNKPSVLEKLGDYIGFETLNKIMREKYDLDIGNSKISYKKIIKSIYSIYNLN
ncbi:hypothetical protein CPAV1605_57 [seawater metagenome]|uniref:Uncharacterized protein n=1 Tax=seawater metagenome TaxID=1561972 RepID=A0A5E8CKP8_9ZZZZ